MLCHVNVIPLNPTGGFAGQPTQRRGVEAFARILGKYGISCTPRVRRGIDINAGCGQLKAEILKRRKHSPKHPSVSDQPSLWDFVNDDSSQGPTSHSISECHGVDGDVEV